MPQGGQKGKDQHKGQRQNLCLPAGQALQKQIEKGNEQAHSEIGRYIPVLPKQHREERPQHPVSVDAARQERRKDRRDEQRIKRRPQPEGNRTAVSEAMARTHIPGDHSVAVYGAVGGHVQQEGRFTPCGQRSRCSQSAALIQNMQNDHHPHGNHPQQVNAPVSLLHVSSSA